MKGEDVLIKAISTYGKSLQSMVAVEELAELQKEVSKNIRGKSNRDAMAEEIADVRIMIWQLMIMNEISEAEVKKIMVKKINRLEGRLSK